MGRYGIHGMSSLSRARTRVPFEPYQLSKHRRLGSLETDVHEWAYSIIIKKTMRTNSYGWYCQNMLSTKSIATQTKHSVNSEAIDISDKHGIRDRDAKKQWPALQCAGHTRLWFRIYTYSTTEPPIQTSFSGNQRHLKAICMTYNLSQLLMPTTGKID